MAKVMMNDDVYGTFSLGEDHQSLGPAIPVELLDRWKLVLEEYESVQKEMEQFYLSRESE
jgi:hypothetical protein